MKSVPSAHVRSGRVPRLPRRQSGVVLFIALIVLVAMTLAGIAMVRSVDTALGIAGNLAFRQASLQATDQAVQQATTFLNTNQLGIALQNDNAAAGYYSAQSNHTWTDPNSAVWAQTVVLNQGNGGFDNYGNKIEYIIHRMCTVANTAYNGGGNQCALYYPNSGGASGGSMQVGAIQFQGIPQIYYRVTTRVTGPRNSVAITQTNILVQV